MERKILGLIKFEVLFLLVLFSLQCLINKIPQKFIKPQIVKSVQEAEALGMRQEVIEGLSQSTNDLIADFRLLNIIYNIDSEHSVVSTIHSKYYDLGGIAQEALNKQIQENIKPNENYSRYWHGTSIILRPLLLKFSLRQIKIILGIALTLLLTWTLVLLIKRKLFYVAIMLILSLILTSSYFVVVSIEYLVVFFIMLISWVYVLKSNIKHLQDCYTLSAALGIAVAFFDFLTVETLPILMLLLLVYNLWQESKLKQYIYNMLIYVFAFGFTFVVRFALVIVVGENFGHIKPYLLGKLTGPKLISNMNTKSSVLLNARQLLLSKSLSISSMLVLMFMLLIVLILCCLIFKQNKSKLSEYKVLLYLGAVPIVRFCILNTHSYYHYFFTYRALTSTVFAIITFYYFYVMRRARRKL